MKHRRGPAFRREWKGKRGFDGAAAIGQPPRYLQVARLRVQPVLSGMSGDQDDGMQDGSTSSFRYRKACRELSQATHSWVLLSMPIYWATFLL